LGYFPSIADAESYGRRAVRAICFQKGSFLPVRSDASLELSASARKAWRQIFKEELELSNSKAKELLQLLYAKNILDRPHLRPPDLSLEKILAFVEQEDDISQ